MNRLAPLFATGLIASLPLAHAAPLTTAEQSVLTGIDGRYEQTEAVAHQIWDWAELGYKETQSSDLLASELEAAGFSIEKSVAGIPTAFIASFKQGDGPVIAILGEFDALPGFSQAASPMKSPIPGQAAGHACGHHLFGAGSVSAAIAVKDWLEATGTEGEIRFYGTPAEEGGSGKVYMVRAGLFDDVDFSIHWHPSDSNAVMATASLANRSAKFRFHGVSAHAAAAPEKGRSALDGVEAFNMMVNMMREHVPQESRIHYVISAGGLAPNVVPDFSEVFYYVRHPHPDQVEEIWARIEDAAKGAAMGTGTTVDWEVIHGNNPLLINEPLALAMLEKLESLGGFTYTPEEQAFAEDLYETLNNPQFEIGEQEKVQPYSASLSFGSTDVGDVSYATPTVGVRTATWVPGTPAHSWQAVAAGGMSIGMKGAQLAAKTMTLTAIELYENEDLRTEARAAFDAARGEDYEYQSLLGDRDPPLDYRDNP
ncbi:MAG: amidohydrolase [Ponticaulis sp.]|nr:amidohydrolase [Ponticaulis sp.]